MQQNIHGGDIYSRPVRLDFSVNGNPLGMPAEARLSLLAAINHVGEYPDAAAGELTETVSHMLSVQSGREIPKEYLLFGNGASELFLAVVHALKPRNIVIPVPSFYGYEYVAEAAARYIKYVYLPEETGFRPGRELLQELTADTDMLFVANPNNPTGQLMGREYLQELLEHCRQQGITVVVDECFIEFCEEEKSIVQKLSTYRNLLIVRAFTKIYAIPGVRLGYLMCSDKELLQKIRGQLPEWNLSVFAEAAGIACLQQQEYLKKTVEYVAAERKFLTEKLQNLGLQVILSDANFILFYSEKPLYEKLLQKGILIRDCKNFQGLSEGYYRVAVKSRRENEILEKAIGECIG